MKSEDQKEELPVEGPGLITRWQRLSVTTALKVIDAASVFLSRLRSRFDASPGGEDASDSGKRRSHPHADDSATTQTIAPQQSRRLIYFFAFALTLIAGAIAGAAYSYQYLSKTITSHSATVERLRDELVEMKKEEALNLKELANRQRIISAYDKGIIRYLKEIDDYKAESEELRRQLGAARSTASNARSGSPNRDNRGSQTAVPTSQQARPPRTGTCVTDPENVAASLAKCVEEFNRK